MADFDLAMPYVFANEGGYSDLESDRGGATAFGITELTARQTGYSGSMRDFTRAQAADIYHRRYWRFTPIDDQRVATKLMDMFVNFGPGHATRIVQQALNALEADLTVDGIYGPMTENTINAVQPDRLLGVLVQGCIDYYGAIVHHSPDQGVFLKGWTRRAKRVPDE